MQWLISKRLRDTVHLVTCWQHVYLLYIKAFKLTVTITTWMSHLFDRMVVQPAEWCYMALAALAYLTGNIGIHKSRQTGQ